MKNTVTLHPVLAALAYAALATILAATGLAEMRKIEPLVVLDDHWTRKRQRDDKTRDWLSHLPCETTARHNAVAFGWA